MSAASRRLLTVQDLQQLLGYRSRNTVYCALRAGRLPAPIRLTCATAHPRWLASEIDSWLIAQAQAAQKEHQA